MEKLNEDLKVRLDVLKRDLHKHRSNLRLHPVGFTKEMDEWMAAADILIGKPGGLTTSEALARGLPMVIVNPIPGQEERNAAHLLEWGCAIRCNSLPRIGYRVEIPLREPERLRRMSANCLEQAKPSAADDILTIALRGTQ